MMTVTFPSGVRVQYSTANYLFRDSNHAWSLYTQKDGQWIASVQLAAGVIVEVVPACAVTAPPIPSAEVALDVVLRQIESGQGHQASSWKVKQLKRALSRFNARSGGWK